MTTLSRSGVRASRLKKRMWLAVDERDQVADRMGVTKGRVSQIEQGRISGQDVLARFAAALGGRLHQAIYFDNGDIAAVA
jgi:transcriptional regulator with XRE-family HTH domain